MLQLFGIPVASKFGFSMWLENDNKTFVGGVNHRA